MKRGVVYTLYHICLLGMGWDGLPATPHETQCVVISVHHHAMSHCDSGFLSACDDVRTTILHVITVMVFSPSQGSAAFPPACGVTVRGAAAWGTVATPQGLSSVLGKGTPCVEVRDLRSV